MLYETLLLALQAIFRNALRSFLTVLGIVIGVAAVIAMLTVGQGSTEQVTADVEKLGTNVLMVLPGGEAMGGPAGTADPMFVIGDVDAVQEEIATVTQAEKTVTTTRRPEVSTVTETKKESAPDVTITKTAPART